MYAELVGPAKGPASGPTALYGTPMNRVVIIIGGDGKIQVHGIVRAPPYRLLLICQPVAKRIHVQLQNRELSNFTLKV